MDETVPARKGRTRRSVASGSNDGTGSYRGPVAWPRLIDSLDKRIIEALQEDGRESFREVARNLRVAEGTVRKRYGQLCQMGVLQVVGVTNPLGLGFEAMAIAGIKVSDPPETVAEEIVKWEEASYVVITAGQFDLLVEFVCLDRQHLLEVTNRVRALPGVASTETFIYLQLCKQLYNWGIKINGGHDLPMSGAESC